MLDWLVVADDRTGALEVAGEMAAAVGPVEVLSGGGWTPTHRAAVVDLGSRHLAPEVAASLAASSAELVARRRGHKIDSTLRGQWAAELVAVRRHTGARVLVVPALPRLGRTCVDGTVHVDGEPLQHVDARHGPVVARPAQLLAEADAVGVAALGSLDVLRGWLADVDGAPFAVSDASTDADLVAIAIAWAAHDEVVFAGTSASIAAAVRAGGCATGANGTERVVEALGRPALVVVGSLHPTARMQLAMVHAAALDGVEVLATRAMSGPVDAPSAERAAARLAADARRRLAAGDVRTLVIVGGDTAAAVLGDHPMLAGGTVAPGVPWSRRADGAGPLVVTKAGGFGGPQTLVELLAGRTAAR